MIPSRIENRAPPRQRQHSPATITLLSLLTLFVVACGNKGPLYLPGEAENRGASVATQASARSPDHETTEEPQDPEAGDEEEKDNDGRP